MALFLDLFGYLSVVVHGLVIATQSAAIGSVLFLVFLARPILGAQDGEDYDLQRSIAHVAGWASVGLLLAEVLYLALQVAAIVGTIELAPTSVFTANFAVAALIKGAAAAILAVLLFGPRPSSRPWILLALCGVALVAATLTTHAAARLGNRGPLMVVELVHQFGAAIWIGGIPVFLVVLARLRRADILEQVGARFSRMSMIGVATLLVSGAVMSLAYIGDVPAIYGTAFGVMVGAKVAMFAMLLGLGLGNFLVVRRLAQGPGSPVLRMRRFAEAEIGIGLTVFFAAASLTSVPPAVDLLNDRASWQEIVERYTPVWPRLRPPSHDSLAIVALQKELDTAAAERGTQAQAATIPGSGDLNPRNAADIAWSEFNHHFAGILVLAIGIMALVARAGFRPARHWPLLFVALGIFLFVWGDPEYWPLGKIGFFESLRDVETFQHRLFVLVIFAFALFEWRVRIRDIRTGWMPLVFPLMCATGGALLLTHQHAIANVKDQLLIELSHTPLALAGILAGWSRWLELRLDPESDGTMRRVASWTWPICLVLVGVILLWYREA